MKNVHTINLSQCDQITDKRSEYLKNVREEDSLSHIHYDNKTIYLKDLVSNKPTISISEPVQIKSKMVNVSNLILHKQYHHEHPLKKYSTKCIRHSKNLKYPLKKYSP